MTSTTAPKVGDGGSGSAQPSSFTLPTTATVDDVVQLATQVGSGLANVQQSLLPALLKLSASHHGKGVETLLNPLKTGEDPLAVLDPSRFTLAYLFILATRVRYAAMSKAPQQVPLNAVDAFVAHHDPAQLLIAGAKATELAQAIASLEAANLINPKWAVQTVFGLYQVFAQASSRTMTTLHAILIMQCYRTDNQTLAYQNVVSTALSQIDRKWAPLQPLDVIDYYYFAGKTCLDVRDLATAEEMFENCVTAPVHHVHQRQVDSAKWLILVQLLREGTTKPLPRYTAAPVVRAVKRGCQAYHQFARNFTLPKRSKSEKELKELVESYDDFTKDGTLPVVTLLVNSHLRTHRILRLGRTFERLRIRDVVELLEIREDGEAEAAAAARALSEVQRLISNRSLSASISATSDPNDPGSAILTFIPRPKPYNNYTSIESIEALSNQMAQLQEWNVFLENKERGLAQNKKVMQQLQSRSGAGGMAGSGAGAGMGGGMGRWAADAGFEDENDTVFS